jgi:hypothetical protein
MSHPSSIHSIGPLLHQHRAHPAAAAAGSVITSTTRRPSPKGRTTNKNQQSPKKTPNPIPVHGTRKNDETRAGAAETAKKVHLLQMIMWGQMIE